MGEPRCLVRKGPRPWEKRPTLPTRVPRCPLPGRAQVWLQGPRHRLPRRKRKCACLARPLSLGRCRRHGTAGTALGHSGEHTPHGEEPAFRLSSGTQGQDRGHRERSGSASAPHCPRQRPVPQPAAGDWASGSRVRSQGPRTWHGAGSSRAQCHPEARGATLHPRTSLSRHTPPRPTGSGTTVRQLTCWKKEPCDSETALPPARPRVLLSVQRAFWQRGRVTAGHGLLSGSVMNAGSSAVR